ncbi:uncharacterized protein LOC126836822 [Adelges cooleyi]|uniref:uncharacterized protein LOC126836822 n=1 Tax=Adelges cooleyi TaxID=133065 RepID=UPI00217FF3F5|nr:uncharacterized protein LOC126836822 [Adelges cooleyi]
MTELNSNLDFVFGLLDDINIFLDGRSNHELNHLNLHLLILDRVHIKGGRLSKHGLRLSFFVMYINSDLKNCLWIRDNNSVLHPCVARFKHGTPIATEVFVKVAKYMSLMPYMMESIMCTPYMFCRDLIDIAIDDLKDLDPISHLSSSEVIIKALVRNLKRMPVQSDQFAAVTEHINKLLMVYNKDTLPKAIEKLNPETQQKEITRYMGHRVRSIFKILVSLIKFNNSLDTYTQYPLYKLQLLRDVCINPDPTNPMLQKFLDVIIHKLMNLCDFNINTWLDWYEIVVTEEDSNLQTIIGELCYDLCELINKKSITHKELLNFMPVLRNVAVEKIDYDEVDTNDINGVIERVKTTEKHLNGWVKKLIENNDVFTHSEAIKTLIENMNRIDYCCFKHIIDRSVAHVKGGGPMSEGMANVILKGIECLSNEDKLKLLKHFFVNHSTCELYLSTNFDELLHFVLNNDGNKEINQDDFMTKLTWIVLQQPKKMFHILMSQYIITSGDFPMKSLTDEKTVLYQVLVSMHKHMDIATVCQEYREWLDVKNTLNETETELFNRWISVVSSKELSLIKPQDFLIDVLLPLLIPTTNYGHLIQLINLIRFFIRSCTGSSLPNVDVWGALIFRLAKILDHARWNLETYSPSRVDLCEKISLTVYLVIEHFLSVAHIDEVRALQKKLAQFPLITRSHFLNIFKFEPITVDGLDEQFIMTIHSKNHISFSNLNGSSTQQMKEEFIFSIATYLPRCTLSEMKYFIDNYFSTADESKRPEATSFLLDSVISAFMRIVVFLKTAENNDPEVQKCTWDCLENSVVNFLDLVNNTEMSCIYQCGDSDLVFQALTKLIMITKQLDNGRQVPLLVIIRRLINNCFRLMNDELIKKILAQIATIKSVNAKDTLGETTQKLLEHLTSRSSQTSSQQ